MGGKKLHIRCDLCKLPIRDPVSLTCCGSHQCKACALDRLKYTNGKCWHHLCHSNVEPENLLEFIELKQLLTKIYGDSYEQSPRRLFCYVCNVQGHRTPRCPTITCIKCNQMGHAEIDCIAHVKVEATTRNSHSVSPISVRSQNVIVKRGQSCPAYLKSGNDVVLVIEVIALGYKGHLQLTQLGVIEIQNGKSKTTFNPIKVNRKIATDFRYTKLLQQFRNEITDSYYFKHTYNGRVTCTTEKAALRSLIATCAKYANSNVFVLVANYDKVWKLLLNRMASYGIEVEFRPIVCDLTDILNSSPVKQHQRWVKLCDTQLKTVYDSVMKYESLAAFESADLTAEAVSRLARRLFKCQSIDKCHKFKKLALHIDRQTDGSDELQVADSIQGSAYKIDLNFDSK